MAQFSFSEESLRALALDALALAKRGGATACEVDVSESLGQSVTVRKGEVETIEFTHDKGLGVTVYLGKRRGHASSADFSPASLSATIEAALAIARHTMEDDCAGLPDADDLARNWPELDLYHPWEISSEEAIELARRCEAAAFDANPAIVNSEGATVSTSAAHFVFANSEGFLGGFPSTRHFIGCTPIAAHGADMQRDDWYSMHRDPHDLASPEAVGAYAAMRAASRLSARKLSTRQCRVMFEAPLATGLIASFVHAASGGSLYRKASFLYGALGARIFPAWMRIEEAPHLSKGLASAPFDDEGVATHARCIVADGVLQGYFLSTYTARKLGMKTTGNAGGSHNLLVSPHPDAPADFAGLLKEFGTGLLVTELLGHGINYVTGDYSRGAAGFWVENGEIAYPVQEITIAGNLKEMFAGIEMIGRDRVTRGSRTVGSIVVNRMTVAGA
ncbi:MAG: metalloprotease PmbA [Rhodocyclaceae bacterium]|nr:metalloprotease PmbA [Rhodocyclaceae bacterium]